MQSMKFIPPFLLLPLVFTLSLWSASPVPYSGKIDIRGVNYFGEAQFAFSLHDGNGSTHWRNGKQPGETIKVTIRNGRYSVLLGGQGMNSLPPELFLSHDKLYLKVEFDNEDGEGLRHLAPDQLITATPRALVAELAKVAQVAEKVGKGAITREMLNPDILDDLNATIEKSRLSPNILSDINRTITYDRLAPSAIHAISSTSLSSITDGKIKVVPFGQTPPSGYSLYHRGKAENLNWEILNMNWFGILNNITSIRGNSVYIYATSAIHKFDLYSNQREKIKTFAPSISGHSTAISGSSFFSMGGGQNRIKSNHVRVYDFGSNTIKSGIDLPIRLQNAVAEFYQGKIYITCGWSDDALNKRLFAFDITEQAWQELASINLARGQASSLVHDGKLWVFGGKTSGNVNTSSVESYDFTTDSWSSEPSILTGRRHVSCWSYKGNLFVAGGKDDNETFDTIECYDPFKRNWYEWGRLPQPIAGSPAFVTGDSVYFYPGEGNIHVLSLDLKKSTSKLSDIYIQDLNTTIPLQAEVADGSVTASKMANNTITTSQLNEQILKYLRPEITTQPQAQNVYSDTNVSFSVTAEGKYLTYQWKKDGGNLTGETNSTLSITDANATLHDGNYSVVVSNDFGSVESGVKTFTVLNSEMDGLIGWWKFDETNGTIAYDSSGNGNNGNLTGGPTWATGKIGGALSFDGIDEYVDLGSSAILNPSEAIAITCWFLPNEISKYAHGIPIVTRYIAGTDFSRKSYVLKYSSLGKPEYYLYNGSSTVAFTPSSLVLTKNQFYFIAVTYSNTGGDMYINDAKVAELELGGLTSVMQSSVSTRIGGWGHNDWPEFNGLIDDVRIYDRALSDAEVQALYNMGQ